MHAVIDIHGGVATCGEADAICAIILVVLSILSGAAREPVVLRLTTNDSH